MNLEIKSLTTDLIAAGPVLSVVDPYQVQKIYDTFETYEEGD
jgi:hypothetical protein